MTTQQWNPNEFGEWRVSTLDGIPEIVDDVGPLATIIAARGGADDNAQLMASAPSLKADLEQALSLLEKHENSDDSGWRCQECRSWDTDGHDPDCTWALLLQKYGRSVKFSD